MSNISSILEEARSNWSISSNKDIMKLWSEERLTEGAFTSRNELYDDLMKFIEPRLPPSRNEVFKWLRESGRRTQRSFNARGFAVTLRTGMNSSLGQVRAADSTPAPSPKSICPRIFLHDENKLFWTHSRQEKARSMRHYRRLWYGIEEHYQWALESKVYLCRGNGMSEEQIVQIIGTSLDFMRPWRLSNAKLARAFQSLKRRVRR